MPSVFTRIINRELPARIFYETDDIIVIADHKPKDNVHLLVIPKQECRNFYDAEPELISLVSETVKLVVDKLGIPDHFRLIINNGYCQEIDQLHFHLLSNRGSERLIFIKE